MMFDLRVGRRWAHQGRWRYARGKGTSPVLRQQVFALAVLAAVAGVVLLPMPATAQLPAPAADTRDEAVRAIPFDEMNEQAHAKLSRVVSNATLYRRLPTQAINCDPDLHVLLVRHPEVVVNIWQLMGVSKAKVKRTGAYTFDASDGGGTVCTVELVYGRPDLHIFYGEGYYEGTLLRQRTYGSCVLVLHSTYGQQGGRPVVSNRLDAFVRLDRIGAEVVAKTLLPVVGKAADFNFTESTKFVGQVNEAAERNGPGMQRLAAKLTTIDPPVREQFSNCAEVVYERAQLRNAAAAAREDATVPDQAHLPDRSPVLRR